MIQTQIWLRSDDSNSVAYSSCCYQLIEIIWRVKIWRRRFYNYIERNLQLELLAYNFFFLLGQSYRLDSMQGLSLIGWCQFWNLNEHYYSLSWERNITNANLSLPSLRCLAESLIPMAWPTLDSGSSELSHVPGKAGPSLASCQSGVLGWLPATGSSAAAFSAGCSLLNHLRKRYKILSRNFPLSHTWSHPQQLDSPRQA